MDEELDVASTRVPSAGRSEPGMLAAAPPAYEPVPTRRAYAPEPARGSYREDGAFEPEGNPSDWDATGSIGKR